MIRTFIDSGVLISAATGRDTLFNKALDILDDAERVFITSDFIPLEVLPKATYFQRQDEVEFYEAFFASVEQTVQCSATLLAQAHLEARSAGLGALDTLHVSYGGKNQWSRRIRHYRAPDYGIIPRGGHYGHNNSVNIQPALLRDGIKDHLLDGVGFGEHQIILSKNSHSACINNVSMATFMR